MSRLQAWVFLAILGLIAAVTIGLSLVQQDHTGAHYRVEQTKVEQQRPRVQPDQPSGPPDQPPVGQGPGVIDDDIRPGNICGFAEPPWECSARLQALIDGG